MDLGSIARSSIIQASQKGEKRNRVTEYVIALSIQAAHLRQSLKSDEEIVLSFVFGGSTLVASSLSVWDENLVRFVGKTEGGSLFIVVAPVENVAVMFSIVKKVAGVTREIGFHTDQQKGSPITGGA